MISLLLHTNNGKGDENANQFLSDQEILNEMEEIADTNKEGE